MITIKMTREMIVEEIKQVACEERAHEFAINRLDFDGLIKNLDELEEMYLKFIDEKKNTFAGTSKELELELNSLDRNFTIKSMKAKYNYYSNAFNFDSEVLIDFDQWYEGAVEEIEEEFDKLHDSIENQ